MHLDVEESALHQITKGYISSSLVMFNSYSVRVLLIPINSCKNLDSLWSCFSNETRFIICLSKICFQWVSYWNYLFWLWFIRFSDQRKLLDITKNYFPNFHTPDPLYFFLLCPIVLNVYRTQGSKNANISRVKIRLKWWCRSDYVTWHILTIHLVLYPQVLKYQY